METTKTCRVGLILLAAVGILAQPSPTNLLMAQESEARVEWTDPTTGLMWAAKDNGRDVSWKGAVKYCRNLRLEAGHTS